MLQYITLIIAHFAWSEVGGALRDRCPEDENEDEFLADTLTTISTVEIQVVRDGGSLYTVVFIDGRSEWGICAECGAEPYHGHLLNCKYAKSST